MATSESGGAAAAEHPGQSGQPGQPSFIVCLCISFPWSDQGKYLLFKGMLIPDR